MLNDFTGADKVYIACGYTDLRKGIDGLATMVQQQFELDPFTNTLFLFCGRKRDRIKGLYWEREDADAAAVPLADGRAEDRTAQSAQSSDWPEYGIALKIGCYFLANH